MVRWSDGSPQTALKNGSSEYYRMRQKSLYTWPWWLVSTLLFFFSAVVIPARGQDKYFSVSGTGYYDDHAIISINADGSNPQMLYDVTAQLSNIPPSGAMIPYQGLLYGTFGGGFSSYTDGFLYSFDPVAANFSILYALNGGNDGTLSAGGGQLIAYPNGKLYGAAGGGGATGWGTIYSWDPVTTSFSICADLPGTGGGCCETVTPLTFYNYKLYGDNAYGGAFGNGYLYCFDPRTNTVKVLYDFPSRTQLNSPMIVYNNKLYGIQQNAGPYNAGLIFSYDAVGGFQPVYSLDKVHGSRPYQILGYQGKLYGVCNSGGAKNAGTIFSFDLATGKAVDLYDFKNSIRNVVGIVIDSSSGIMSGFTSSGGPSNNGVFFQFNLATHQLTSFDMGSAGPAAQGITFVPGTGGTTAQTVSFNALPVKTYGDPDFSAGVTVSSGLPITYTSSNLNVAWTNGDQIHIVGAGTTTITASQAGNAVYASQSVSQTLTVSQAGLLIGVRDTVLHQGDAVPSFVLTYAGFVNGDTASSLLTPPVAVTTANGSSPLGPYPITVSGATSGNYNITYQPGVLTVIGPAQHIQFTDTLKTYGDVDFATATVNTGLPLTYASSNSAVATITSDNKIHITGAGRDTLTISQAGNSEYGYTSISKVLTVLPATLTIAVNNTTGIYRQSIPAFSATYTGLTGGDTPESLQTIFSSTGTEAGAQPGAYLIYAVAIRHQDSINYNIIANQPGTLLIYPAAGNKNNLDAWFSGPGSLQVAVFATQQTSPGQQVGLKVFDVTGRPCLNTQLSLTWGFNTFSIPISNMPAGVYIVQISGKGIQLSKTITKLL